MSDTPTDSGNTLQQAVGNAGDQARELREKAAAGIQQARDKVADVQVVVVERGKKVARATDDYVHESPWRSIGMAAGVGVLVGLLLNRR